MALSKRVRYEILRRDNHTCRYCGGTAPDVVLTVDHVVPVALGGGDGPENLVTACKDCNAGKSSTSPDAPLVADISRQAMVYAKALKVIAAQTADAVAAREAYRKAFLECWEAFDDIDRWLAPDWVGTLKRWHEAQVPIGVVLEAVEISFGAWKVRNDSRFRYMAGIVWARLTEMQDAAGASLRDDDSISDHANRSCQCCNHHAAEVWSRDLFGTGECLICGGVDDALDDHDLCHATQNGWLAGYAHATGKPIAIGT